MRKIFGPVLTIALAIVAYTADAATPLVDVAWAKANLGKPNVVFLDVRGKLDNSSKADYLRAHIPGAIWTDYLKDGWRYKDKNGTIGQLSPVPNLEKLIGGLGIGNDDHVVIVPLGGAALDVGTATRIYWTFKVLSHDNVSILNGGMLAYTKEVDAKTKQPVNPLEKGAVTRKAKTFKAKLRTEMLAGKDDIQKAMKAGVTLVDNRPNDQYLGINKHDQSKRNGTVPGAKNLPESWMTENGGGQFRDKAALEQLYKLASVPTSGEQINFCNTGHWASIGWFVSHEIIGNKNVKMYDGSMVEWSADANLPIQSAIPAK